jgi:hypothetical protein
MRKNNAGGFALFVTRGLFYDVIQFVLSQTIIASFNALDFRDICGGFFVGHSGLYNLRSWRDDGDISGDIIFDVLGKNVGCCCDVEGHCDHGALACHLEDRVRKVCRFSTDLNLLLYVTLVAGEFQAAHIIGHQVEFLGANRRIANYVTNRLLEETEDEDPKVRLKALELLGKRKGVNLFSDQMEITVKQKSTTDLEGELATLLEKYMGDAEVIENPAGTQPIIDIDAELAELDDPEPTEPAGEPKE